MVTNPYNAYTYWHLTQDSITKGYALFDEKREDVEEIVRVIDISTTPSKKNVFFCDTKVRFANGDTWLPLGVQDKEFVVEIGLLSKCDEFSLALCLWRVIFFGSFASLELYVFLCVVWG